jgi:predicted ester cyclase
MGDIQPTGKQAKWTGIDILEVEGGKIAGRWSQRDLLGLMQQLGVQ